MGLWKIKILIESFEMTQNIFFIIGNMFFLFHFSSIIFCCLIFANDFFFLCCLLILIEFIMLAVTYKKNMKKAPIIYKIWFCCYFFLFKKYKNHIECLPSLVTVFKFHYIFSYWWYTTKLNLTIEHASSLS